MGSPIWRLRGTVVAATLFTASACGGGDSANPFGDSTAGGGDSAAGASGGSGAGTGGNSATDGGSTATTGGRAGDTAGTASGGTGAAASGGAASGAGGVGQRVDGGSTDCEPDMKVCQGICVPFDPFVGCAADTCAPCPEPPPNASSNCVDGSCGYECNAGYRLDGFDCIAYAGSDGGVDSGTGGTTNPGNCPSAQPTTGDLCVALPFGCTYGDMTCHCLAGAGLPIWYCAAD